MMLVEFQYKVNNYTMLKFQCNYTKLCVPSSKINVYAHIKKLDSEFVELMNHAAVHDA